MVIKASNGTPEAAHSPEPWELVLYEGGSATVTDSGGFEIAEFCYKAVLEGWDEKHPEAKHWSRLPDVTYVDRPEEEVEANARLFVAAPLMLKELQHLVRLLEPLLEEGVRIPGMATMNGAKRAIAQALGDDQ